MKLTVFQSEKGDCLLLTSKDALRRILVDGGMRASYTSFVAPALGALAVEGKKLDLVYVSHIDQDHIAGVLQLMDDVVAWRVHDFHVANGNPTHPEPDSLRPPQVEEIWHNAFHEQIGQNAGEIGDVLAATAAILSGADDDDLRVVASEQRELATSIPEAIKLSRRISVDQLGIPLNKRFEGKLAFARSDQTPPPLIRLDPLQINVIGPFSEDLDRLRREWNRWLKDNKEMLARIRKKAREDAERMGTNDVRTLLDLRIAQAREMGDRTKVTPPNLASLMLFVVENGRTLLLTGDGHAADILKGLKSHGRLDAEGRLHVNVLKVQHHGSEHNLDRDFVSKVTADHYIFCGNGEHENPDLQVVQAVIDSRTGSAEVRATNEQASGAFKLWFNSSESASKHRKAKEHMGKVKRLVEGRVSGGRMSFEFLEGSTPSFELTV
ncbi:MAG: MBL fold metallo-hydrolase [Armatimonadota bacterium]